MILKNISLILICTISLTACSFANQATTRNAHKTNVPTPKTESSVPTNATQESTEKQRPNNPLFDTSLTLPNGQVVTTSNSVKWKDMTISLQIQGIPELEPRYLSIVGNHSTVITHDEITTPAGPATLILNKRTPPAAAQSTNTTFEYWVIVYGSQYAYIIEATLTGNHENAKAEVLALLDKWKVPK